MFQMDKLAIGFCLAFMLFVPCADAGELGDTAKKIGKAVFSDVERRVIREYYEAKYGDMDDDGYNDEDDDADDGEPAKKGKKSGKAKKGKKHKKDTGPGKAQSLPPGIAKKLARGGELPPGLAKRRLPPDLESRLPPPPDGYERVQVGRDVVLIQQATQILEDLIRLESEVDDMADIGDDGNGRGPDHISGARGQTAKPEQAASKKAWWEFWKD
jgi:Ni/Co efflux regulator RcnB